jgi:hypothetical protein
VSKDKSAPTDELLAEFEDATRVLHAAEQQAEQQLKAAKERYSRALTALHTRAVTK